MSKQTYMLCFLLILVCSVFSAGLFSVLESDNFYQGIEDYTITDNVVYLQNLPQDVQDAVYQDLLQQIDKYQGFLIRGDSIISDSELGQGYRIGFYGNVEKNKNEVLFEWLGSRIFDENNIAVLLNAQKDKTLGLDISQIDMLQPLPRFRGLTKVIGVKLQDLVDSSGSVHGAYRVIGLSNEQFMSLISSLSNISGKSEDYFLYAKSGQVSTDNTMVFFLAGGLFIAWLLLTFLIVINVYKRIYVFGIHLLLGWTKTQYALHLLFPLLLLSFTTFVISESITLYFAESFTVNFRLIIQGIFSNTFTIFLTAAACLLCLIMIASIKPLNAIKGKTSHVVIIATLIITYLGLTTALMAGCVYIDGSLQQINSLRFIRNQWQQYANFEVLSDEAVGDNASTFLGKENLHSEEWFNWYKSIENKNGVYLIYTTYANDEVLKIWRENNIYRAVPNNPFWTFTASSSYLDYVGFSYTQEAKEQAHMGKRVYFIPNNYSEDDKLQMKEYLRSFSQDRDLSVGLKTQFMTNPEVVFYEYSPSKEYFCWNVNVEGSQNVSNPIILLATRQNMIPMESESLWAQGLSNNYLKLNQQATQSYVTNEYLAQFNLDDNKPVFKPISEYIAGITKTLTETIQLFGSVLAVFAVLELLMILSLTSIFSLAQSEQIAVLRLLGFNLTFIYKPLVIFIIAVCACSCIVSLMNSCKIGMVTALILGCLQILFLFMQARRMSAIQISKILKD